ncbi:MAG: transporter [Vicinamibacterales bacterium]
MTGRVRCGALAVWLISCGAAATAAAQELEPKAYAASPVGGAFVVAGFARSTGAIVFDPTLLITNAEAKVNSGLLATGYTFGLFGKLALATASVPYSWGDISGDVAEQARTTSRSGLSDARFKLSVNLVGNPAMRAREFVKAPRTTIVGTSLTAVAPSGQYYDAKLINLGGNRWAFKPELGVAMPKGRWDVDAYLGVWLFTDNTDAYPGGNRRSQDPVVSLQGHVSYTFRPRLWLAFDATWYNGGSAQIEGKEPTRSMNNSRLGATFSVPVGQRQSLKLAYNSGVFVRTGTNFTSLSVGWQWLWLTKK